MSLVRSIARPLLAAPFIYEGVQTARRPERVVEILPVSLADLEAQVEKTQISASADQLLRATGAVAAIAGTAFALNKAPRLSAAVLLATTTLGLAGRKKVWELRGEEQLEEIRSIAGDLGLFGGILLAVVDTDGKPSLAYRVDKLIAQGQKAAAQKQRELEKAKGKNSSKASKTLDDLDRSLAKKINRA